MEFLMELIFDIILEGSLELGTGRKVPMPVRILAILLLLAFFGGFVVIFAIIGIDAWKQGDFIEALFVLVVDINVIFAVIWLFRKKYKEKDS